MAVSTRTPPPIPPNSALKTETVSPWSAWTGPLALLGPSGLLLLLLLVIPTLVIFQLSLVPNIKPGDVVNPSGIANYLRVFEPINLQVMGRSLFFAIGTTVICLLLGFPVAYWSAQMAPKRWQNLLLLGFILPLWTSSLLRSYAWITILRPTGVMNTVLTSIGLPARSEERRV